VAGPSRGSSPCFGSLHRVLASMAVELARASRRKKGPGAPVIFKPLEADDLKDAVNSLGLPDGEEALCARSGNLDRLPRSLAQSVLGRGRRENSRSIRSY
jgi:hypothetical protein